MRELYRNSLENTDNAVFSLGGETLSYPVGALLPVEFEDYFGKSYNWLPGVYISEAALKELVDSPAVYEIELGIEKRSQAQALNMVKNLIVDNENIILYSGIEYRLEAQTIVSTLQIIGNSIAAILGLTGVLNFINVIIMGILSRQREFALLESVGQSIRQRKSELTCEGTIYAAVTFIMVSTLGSVIIYGLFYMMRQQFDYMNFAFPFVSLLAMIIAIFSVCALVPGFVYRYIGRASIVERLKI